MKAISKLGPRGPLQATQSFGASLAFAVLLVLASAGNAQAVDQEVVMCSENASLCASSKIRPAGDKITAASEHTVFLDVINESGDVLCDQAVFEAETLSSGGMGEPLLGRINNMSFPVCDDVCQTITAVAVPYHYEVSMDEETGSFLMTIKSVLFEIRCALGIVCNYRAENVDLNVENSDSGLPLLSAKNVRLEKEAKSHSFCSQEAAWDAHYVIVKPDPVWFSLFQLT